MTILHMVSEKKGKGYHFHKNLVSKKGLQKQWYMEKGERVMFFIDIWEGERVLFGTLGRT